MAHSFLDMEDDDRVENLLTSYRIGKPEIQRYPPTYENETPRNAFSDTPPETQKIRNSCIIGVFFLVFSGYFFSRSPVVGGIRMLGWYFWPFFFGGGLGGFSSL